MLSMPGSRQRSAAELNEQIRNLIVRSGGRLSGRQRAEYQTLLLEWAAAAPDADADGPAAVPDPRKETADGATVR